MPSLPSRLQLLSGHQSLSPYNLCFDLVPKSLQHIDLELSKPAPQCGEAFRIDFVNAFPSFSVFAYQASFSEDPEMV